MGGVCRRPRDTGKRFIVSVSSLDEGFKVRKGDFIDSSSQFSSETSVSSAVAEMVDQECYKSICSYQICFYLDSR